MRSATLEYAEIIGIPAFLPCHHMGSRLKTAGKRTSFAVGCSAERKGGPLLPDNKYPFAKALKTYGCFVRCSMLNFTVKERKNVFHEKGKDHITPMRQ